MEWCKTVPASRKQTTKPLQAPRLFSLWPPEYSLNPALGYWVLRGGQHFEQRHVRFVRLRISELATKPSLVEPAKAARESIGMSKIEKPTRRRIL